MKSREEYIEQHPGRLKWGCLILLIFISGCGLLDNDNKGRCAINCEDWQFMRIDRQPAWSPNGETIAFIRGSTDPGKHGIYLIDSDGENLQQFHAGVAGSPTWSPDGEWVAFHQGAQIYKKHTETDSLVQLTAEERNFHASWSTCGKFIAYSKSIGENRGLWVMDKKGNEHSFIEFIGAYPDWHPLDDKILFRKDRSEDGFTQGNEIWEYDMNTERKTLLSFLSDEKHFDTRYLKYSPSGQRIVFTSQPRNLQSNFAYPQIWTMDLDDTYRKQLTEKGGWAADWSPDGEWIVYTETYNTGRLWLMRPDGSGKQQLTFE